MLLTIYDAWREKSESQVNRLTIGEAIDPAIWGVLTLREIKENGLKPSWLLVPPVEIMSIDEGLLKVENEKEKIKDSLIKGKNVEKVDKILDDLVRRVLRKWTGPRGLRTAGRALYSDCPLAAAWWLGKIVNDIFGDEDVKISVSSVPSVSVDKKACASILLKKWRYVADSLVAQFTFLCERDILAGVVLAMKKYHIDNGKIIPNRKLVNIRKKLGPETAGCILGIKEVFELSCEA